MKICDDILYNVIIIKNLISNNTYVWNKFLVYFISSPGSHKFFKPCRTFLLIDLRLLWACCSLCSTCHMHGLLLLLGQRRNTL